MAGAALRLLVILFLHNRYRTTGGEERAVEDFLWLVREHLGEDAELLQRDSGGLGRSAAASGLLAGGLHPDDVARAVRRTGARIVHAHNLQPSLGWRALAAARSAGARVVVHLHQYRMVCAVGTCFTEGEECTRCHGRNTLPGIVHNCRGSRPEALAYAAGLAMWQRRLARQVGAFIVPSRFARARLAELGAPVDDAHVLPDVVRDLAATTTATAPRPAWDPPPDGPALLATRLAPEKGLDVAIEACRQAGRALIVAGDGPDRQRLTAAATGAVTFLGHVDDQRLAELRRQAALALAPSRSAETFGLAAAEAMAAGLPVAGSRIGALAELLPDRWLAPPGDAGALAAAMSRVLAEPKAGETARQRIQELASPAVVAAGLERIYAEVSP